MIDEPVTDSSRERFERFLERLESSGEPIASWTVGAALFDQMNAFGRDGRLEQGVRALRRMVAIGSADERLSAQELAAWGRYVLGVSLGHANRIEEAVAEYEQLESMGTAGLNVVNVMIGHYRDEADSGKSARQALAGAMSIRIRMLEALPEPDAQDVERARYEFLDCFDDDELDQIDAMVRARLARACESKAVLDETSAG